MKIMKVAEKSATEDLAIIHYHTSNAMSSFNFIYIYIPNTTLIYTLIVHQDIAIKKNNID